jgi:molecular chaperone GrpE
VADILSLALKSIEEKTPKDKSLKSIDEGITLTKNVLMKVFKKYGLITVSPLGEKFDPNIHEAVLEIPRVEVYTINT